MNLKTIYKNIKKKMDIIVKSSIILILIITIIFLSFNLQYWAYIGNFVTLILYILDEVFKPFREKKTKEETKRNKIQKSFNSFMLSFETLFATSGKSFRHFLNEIKSNEIQENLGIVLTEPKDQNDISPATVSFLNGKYNMILISYNIIIRKDHLPVLSLNTAEDEYIRETLNQIYKELIKHISDVWKVEIKIDHSLKKVLSKL